jgi:hypothetical protein
MLSDHMTTSSCTWIRRLRFNWLLTEKSLELLVVVDGGELMQEGLYIWTPNYGIVGNINPHRSKPQAIQDSCISSFPDRNPGDLDGGILHIGARRMSNNSELIAEAVRVASEPDIAIVCLGMDKDAESEGFDRSDMMSVGTQIS